MIRLRSFLSLACVVALAASLAGQGPAGASRYRMSQRHIADGVTLIRITDSHGPNRIRVLKIDPTKAAMVDVGLPSGLFPSYGTTGAIARAYGAVGAVNGDFALFGHPLHPFIEDAQIQVLGSRLGNGFSEALDEQAGYVGRRVLRVRAIAPDSKQTIARWNFGDPRGDQLGAFTRIGGSVEAPPKHACQVRLSAADSPQWMDASRTGVARRYRVSAKACRRKALSPGKHRSTVVLSAAGANGPTAHWVRSLPKGASIRIEWRIAHWPGVTDRIGGVPLLLEDGNNVAPANCGSYFCDRNPRTGVGTTPDGQVLFITVDGRQHDSVGMTLPEFASVFKTLGSNWALNLDGGGSTTMLAKYRGKLRVVNQPAVSTHRDQRPITSALLVLGKRDPHEPSTLFGSDTASGLVPVTSGLEPVTSADVSVGPAAARRAWAAAVRDPGSTGGLLAAEQSGGLGATPALSPDLQRIVQQYRRVSGG